MRPFYQAGIDSSSVVALMSQIAQEPVVTTSIGFQEKDFNEVEFAREVAQQYHTRHYERNRET
ncbi:MAG: asparagine synthase-related protein [Nitrospirales bacterium]